MTQKQWEHTTKEKNKVWKKTTYFKILNYITSRKCNIIDITDNQLLPRVGWRCGRLNR